MTKQEFVTLSQDKNIVILTNAPIGRKCQAIFLHSVVGCSITPEEQRYVVRSRLKMEIGMEIDPDIMLATTSKKFVPELKDLMKDSSSVEVENQNAPRSGTRRKSNTFTVLKPSLVEACRHTNMI